MPLRKLSESDLDDVLRWRNAAAVRENMFSKHEITSTEHMAWFDRMTIDTSCRWYVFDSDNGRGVVYFTQYKPADQSSFWGFYASTDSPAGIGTRMELAALDHAFEHMRLHKLNCEVISSNLKVINLHKKFGFNQEGLFHEHHFNGEKFVDVVRLGILNRDWPLHRPKIITRLDNFQ